MGTAGPVIAIDGPAGSGKSTLARRLAEALGLPYVNTGLMYRALTLQALRKAIAPEDGNELAALAARMKFDLSFSSGLTVLLIDGELPSEALASPEVERDVSRVSSHRGVRAIMREEQRRLGRHGAVMEGRDIGSVVFPEAVVKVFLVAEPGERATRRVKERDEVGNSAGAGTLAEALAARDARDALVNPPVPAPDAVAIDTTDKQVDAVFEQVLDLVRDRLADLE
jgi:cytidylate kinase